MSSVPQRDRWPGNPSTYATHMSIVLRLNVGGKTSHCVRTSTHGHVARVGGVSDVCGDSLLLLDRRQP